MQPLPISKKIILVVLIKYIPMTCRVVIVLGFLRFRNRRTALSSQGLCHFCFLVSRRWNVIPSVLREDILIILGTISFEREEESTFHHHTVR